MRHCLQPLHTTTSLSLFGCSPSAPVHDYRGAAEGINVNTCSCLVLSFTLVLPHNFLQGPNSLNNPSNQALECWPLSELYQKVHDLLRSRLAVFCNVVVVAVVVSNYKMILLRLDDVNWVGQHFSKANTNTIRYATHANLPCQYIHTLCRISLHQLTSACWMKYVDGVGG